MDPVVSLHQHNQELVIHGSIFCALLCTPHTLGIKVAFIGKISLSLAGYEKYKRQALGD